MGFFVCFVFAVPKFLFSEFLRLFLYELYSFLGIARFWKSSYFLLKAQTEFDAYPIPTTAQGDKDATEAGHTAATLGKKAE